MLINVQPVLLHIVKDCKYFALNLHRLMLLWRALFACTILLINVCDC